MGWFSRRRSGSRSSADARAAVAEFWEWWSGAAFGIAAAIPAGTVERYVEVMTHHVHAIDPGLAWEFGPGTSSEHRLTVTAEGDPSLRRVARRWLRAAPPPDRTWSFHDMRQPSALDSVLRVGDAELMIGDVRVAATRRGSGLDVEVHHPLFARLPEQVQTQIAFLSLDTALGEEAVELWIGSIDRMSHEPSGSRPLADLPAKLAEVIADATVDGEMGWTLQRGNGPRGPVLVSRLNRLSPVQAPDHDEHVAVVVPFRDVTEDGWPGTGSLDALRDFEDHLGRILRGSGQLVAVETSGGVRTLHYYVDSTTPAAGQVKAAVVGWDQGVVTVKSQSDPAWKAVAAFRS
ncbi:MAG: DUF695 domain-containing protein [Propionicimonas sp.]|uniref:DUF695 domain-containing protein n=1 Tax=Propionicimonas sp. TaxID=1955623 RepID=UPI003D13CB06